MALAAIDRDKDAITCYTKAIGLGQEGCPDAITSTLLFPLFALAGTRKR